GGGGRGVCAPRRGWGGAAGDVRRGPPPFRGDGRDGPGGTGREGARGVSASSALLTATGPSRARRTFGAGPGDEPSKSREELRPSAPQVASDRCGGRPCLQQLDDVRIVLGAPRFELHEDE